MYTKGKQERGNKTRKTGSQKTYFENLYGY